MSPHLLAYSLLLLRRQHAGLSARSETECTLDIYIHSVCVWWGGWGGWGGEAIS